MSLNTMIPEGWKRVTLDDVATEYSVREDNPAESDFERFVGSNHIGRFELRVSDWGSTSEVTSAMKVFQPGDYLLVRRSLYASDFRERAARADFSGLCSGDILTLREKKDVIAPGFLSAILNTPNIWAFIVENATGSITRRIKWKQLKGYEFALPPLDEQRRILEVLQSASNSANRMTELSHHAFNVESAYVRSEIPPITRASGRASLPTEFLAAGWTVQRVDQLGRVLRGSSPRPKSDPRYYGGSVPRLTVEDINRDGMYVTARVDSLTEEGAKLSRPVPRGTLVMVCSGNIGEPSILAEDACIHDGILAVTELRGQVSAEYLYYAFRTLKREFLRLTTNGGIWSNLTTDVLKSIVVPVPPIECLQETVDRITQFTSTIEAVKQRQADYKKLTQSLVNSLLDRGDHR